MEDKNIAVSMAVTAYFSANKATSIGNPAEMQICSSENAQFSLNEFEMEKFEMEKFGALDLRQLANRDCCAI